MKTKKNIWFLLPKQLKEDINKIQFRLPNHKDKALKFIRIILKKNQKDNFDSLKYREFASAYLKKIFKGDYKDEFMNLLVENEIIQVNNAYSLKSHTPKSFRIHESYFTGNLEFSSTSYSDSSYLSTDSIIITPLYSLYVFIPYLLPDFKRLSLKQSRINFPLTKTAQELGVSAYPYLNKSLMLPETTPNPVTYIRCIEKDSIGDMIDSLNINYTKMLDKVQEVVSGISYNNFTIDSEIDTEFFEVYNRITSSSQWMTKQGAITTAQKFNATLIQDKDKFYIDDLDRYIEIKKQNILVSYNTSITALRKRIYSINRNNTNFRLDTVFTSMCSHTLDIIKEDNNLIEIDLVNSQYAIFANWLMAQTCFKEKDVKKFCELAIQGGLYEYISEQLNLDNRKQAKKIMMIVAFSSYRFKSIQKSQFKELFPNVYQFINDYNKENNGRFAVCLQNKESRIFIDGLMQILITKGYFVITKHDSLIIKESDKDAVIKIVQDYFRIINFKASIKVDNEIIHNGVSEHQILDESEKQAEYQAEPIEKEIGCQKHQLPDFINLDMITPFDNSRNIYDHLEPFKYHGCSVQTVKYYMDNCKLNEFDAEEFYNEQFRQIESMV